VQTSSQSNIDSEGDLVAFYNFVTLGYFVFIRLALLSYYVLTRPCMSSQFSISECLSYSSRDSASGSEILERSIAERSQAINLVVEEKVQTLRPSTNLIWLYVDLSGYLYQISADLHYREMITIVFMLRYLDNLLLFSNLDEI
jgi:hypothetical protein